MRDKRNKTWTEYEICKRLSGPFPSPAYVVLPQVRNGTGFSRRTVRTADALIISTWPGRGLWIGGVEIKVYLQDWKRELANAEKSEMQQWCKYWWVAAPKGLIPQNEVPETWGLLECEATRTFVTVKAPALDHKPPDMLLFCSIIRALQENHVHKDEVHEKAEELAKRAKEDAQYRVKTLETAMEDYKKASGIDLLSDPWYCKGLGEAVKLVKDSGLLNGKKRLQELHAEAKTIVQGCAKLLGEDAANLEATTP